MTAPKWDASKCKHWWTWLWVLGQMTPWQVCANCGERRERVKPATGGE